MAAEIEGIFRNELNDLILSSKLLVVGAGGIGCEILKNLVMCGFKDIEIVSELCLTFPQQQQQLSLLIVSDRS